MSYPLLSDITRHVRHVGVSTIFLIFAVMLVACGGQTTQPTSSTQSKAGGNISVGLNSDVVTLDPLKSSALVDRQVNNLTPRV